MPKKNPKSKLKNKNKKKNKQNKQNKNNKKQNNKNVDLNENKEVSSRKELLRKYGITLGPDGYVPAPVGTPISFSIHEYSMMDPGGGRELLTKTTLSVGEGHIYGLVGKNGFGKTTLLKHMYSYDIQGFPKHIRMILVNQEEELSEDNVLTVVLNADTVRTKILTETERIYRIQSETDENDQDKFEELQKLVDYLEEIREEENIELKEKRAMKILFGLGFSKEQIKKRVIDLSGGWQMRVKLAKALFVEPDLMLLDEPTNHLDFPTVLWLQKYLSEYDKTVIIVSHDRAFLNDVCTHTIHLTQKSLQYYKGNYDTMMKTSSFGLKEQVSKWESLQKEIKEIKDWINKYKKN